MSEAKDVLILAIESSCDETDVYKRQVIRSIREAEKMQLNTCIVRGEMDLHR